MGTLLLASEMPVPIPRNRTVEWAGMPKEHTQKQKLDHGIVDTQRLYYMTNMIAECTQSLNARR